MDGKVCLLCRVREQWRAPDCTIKICARERGYELCSFCHDPDSCTNFEWLKEHGSKLKEKLKESRRLPKEEFIRR
jgi:hypothetical protein